MITDGSLVASKKKLNNEQSIKSNNLTITKKALQKNIMDNLNSGQIIAKISIIALLSIGISELIVGYWGGSMVLNSKWCKFILLYNDILYSISWLASCS